MRLRLRPPALAAVLLALVALPSACDDGDGTGEDATLQTTTGGDATNDGEADTATASGEDASAPDLGDTAATDADGADTTTTDADADAEADGGMDDRVPATEYCERSAEIFCPYYMRCGRMAVADLDACLVAFAEGCEDGFEPVYASHAARGELGLSASGLAACDAHLQTVACAEQLFDLDGPCGDVWVGEVGTGGTCGPGIGSFVCNADTTCVLDLATFCGTCEPAAAVGEPCEPGVVRCHADARCVDAGNGAVCVARALPGATCNDTQPCVTGAACRDGVCEGFATVGVGAACDQANRCQYKAECVGGVCVGAAAQGESCASAPCQSGGYCDPATSVCVALDPGAGSCAEARACVSLLCADGACAVPPAGCFL